MNDANESSRSGWWGWVREVTSYQWLVLLVAWLGWVFDAMDGTIYAMVQRPVITELLGPGASQADVGFYSSAVFSVMLIGWALGGIVFGILADYIGRTKALTITILIYSLFTGLSALAENWWQLAIFRFVTGLGLGGEWAAGAALVAEVWPDRLRARAGSILQSAAGVGFLLAAAANSWVGSLLLALRLSRRSDSGALRSLHPHGGEGARKLGQGEERAGSIRKRVHAFPVVLAAASTRYPGGLRSGVRGAPRSLGRNDVDSLRDTGNRGERARRRCLERSRDRASARAAV